MKNKASEFWPVGYSAPMWLPDWKNADAYSPVAKSRSCLIDTEAGSVKQNTVDREKPDYSWEFLRRNPNYQADYRYIADLCGKEKVEHLYKKALGFDVFIGTNHFPPSSLFHRELYNVLGKWGLGYYLLDPSFDINESGPLNGVRRIGNDTYPSRYTQSFSAAEHESNGRKFPVDGGILLTETETRWLFDVSLPIDPQIKQARTFLEAVQKQKCGRLIQASKTEPRKFIQYLRILDADACGADDKEIMAILFPGKDTFSYEDSKGIPYKNITAHRNPGRDMLRNHRNATYELRDEGYRRLFA